MIVLLLEAGPTWAVRSVYASEAGSGGSRADTKSSREDIVVFLKYVGLLDGVAADVVDVAVWGSGMVA